MGKKNKKQNQDAGQSGDQRARGKVNHRDGGKGRGGAMDNEDHVPQELIDKAAMLGCEVWQIDEFEARQQMRERGSDEEQDDSDLSEESKQAVKPRTAKANMASAAREMPPSESSEEEGPVTEVIPEEEEKKGESEAEEEEDSDDDAELERLYGMGRNNNKEVAVVPQAKQGREE